ncbi:unnamed protein product [Adineta steineri]|uniref:Uncharacterized protein n=1 Tax=Adineta steineri TaxID=433720 RepID=A0A818V8P9_9BILA|nr:unnamed protein product [Adineta steineri]CAF1455897.1 unnamed protein product [Adineta steineri]CAF3534203.1 unnamed protein product [Adineta steineri]CAF3709209.1 unnamed protein product [Adineta steineri]CAF3973953.1 unnamed protein product [Adineta steineri]
MTSSNNDLDDDLMMFTMDPLNALDEEDESSTHLKSDLSTSDYHSFVAATDISLINESSPIELINNNNDNNKKKMFDITELLGSSSFDDRQEICNWFEKLQPISTSSPSLCVVDYLRAQTLKHDQDIQWQIEQNRLKYDSKQLSPSDYLTRQSLYNRPVAFEKDSRSWARSLLDNFKKTTSPTSLNKSSSFNCSFIKKSPSFDHHLQYIEHLNECNDYPAYLEYLNENRSQLFYTLTDSLDIIDGLLGTVVSSF